MEGSFISGIEDDVLQGNMLYPNPTSDVLNLDWHGSKSVTVFNLVGETCLAVTTNDNAVSLQTLDSGIYLVAVHDKDGEMVVVQKVMKL